MIRDRVLDMEQYPEGATRFTAKLSKRTRKCLVMLVLVFYGQAISVSCSIRYGFLADSFGERNISGKVYGLVGSSLFIGYAFIYFMGLAEQALKRLNSRDLLAGIMSGYFVLQLATGFSYQFQNNITLITVSFALRILQGVLAYPGYLVPLDFINANFHKEFDFVNGLLNMGYFTGHGLAEVIGCILYDNFGYEVAFVFSAVMALLAVILMFLVIPKSRTYLSTQKDIKTNNYNTINSTNNNTYRLTKFLIIPLLACMCINANYGVLQVAVTPFLKEEFSKSISYGGSVLMLVSLGMGAGGFSSGLLLQRRIFNTFTVMAIGAVGVCLGLLLTFPPEFIPAMYNIAPIIAFPGGLLAGVGNPLITIATLRSMYDIQKHKRGVLPPKVATRITGIWLIGYCSLYYMGSFIAGFLIDYFTYSEMALILAGFCLLAVVTCVCMRLFRSETTGDTGEKSTVIRNDNANNDSKEQHNKACQMSSEEGEIQEWKEENQWTRSDVCLVLENHHVVLTDEKKRTEETA